jgi:hypothetical protein
VSDLHRALTVSDADGDAGWAAAARGLGITDAELSGARAAPRAEAADLVAITREHGLRSAHEGTGVAWVLDRRLTQAYLTTAWQVYEARRAAREVLWGITALLESARTKEANGG